MTIHFPLELQRALWPKSKGKCGVCNGDIQEKAVYLNAGAIADLDRSKIVDQEAFWHCGIHTADPRQSIDLKIVETPDQDQFELSFCSVDCLEAFFGSIIKELRNKSKL